MNDIFLSYKSEDIAKAQIIAKALEQKGYSVWWDRIIPIGKRFDEVITEELDAARCVIVLWSKKSVSSDWVKEEADKGKKKQILIPVLIDDVKMPMGFGRIQAAQLIDWQGTLPSSDFDLLLNSVAEIVGRLPQEEAKRLELEKEETERQRKEEEERKEKEEQERLLKQREREEIERLKKERKEQERIAGEKEELKKKETKEAKLKTQSEAERQQERIEREAQSAEIESPPERVLYMLLGGHCCILLLLLSDFFTIFYNWEHNAEVLIFLLILTLVSIISSIIIYKIFKYNEISELLSYTNIVLLLILILSLVFIGNVIFEPPGWGPFIFFLIFSGPSVANLIVKKKYKRK